MTAATNNFYTMNLSLLEAHHPETYQQLMTLNPMPLGKIFPTDSGHLNLSVPNSEGTSTLLHYQDDPKGEVPQFLNLISEDSKGVVTLLGMGLGYSPMGILKERPQIRHLVIFELFPGIFKQALTHMDLTPLLSDPRVIIHLGAPEDIRKVLEPTALTLQLENIYTLRHLTSCSLDPLSYEKLYNDVYDVVNHMSVEGATTIALGETFVTNRLRQFSAMHHHHLTEHLKDRFLNVPAILVSGGPSLDKNVHLLSQVKDKAVIIACDTILSVLLDHGVTPHFVSSIDPKDSCYENIASVAHRTKGTSLLLMSWVTPLVPKCFPADHIFWTFTRKPIETWINRMMGGSMSTQGAGTVAQLNLDAAIIMGCSPIVFIGQDFAYTGQKDHAANIALSDQDRIKKLLASDDLLWMKGSVEEKVPSSRDFLFMKRMFESTIKTHPGTYIDATEGGAYIEGTHVHPLKTVIATFGASDHQIRSRIQSAVAEKMEKKEDTGKWVEAIEKVYERVLKLVKWVNQATKLIPQIRAELSPLMQKAMPPKTMAELPHGLQKDLATLDRLNQKTDQTEDIWEYLEEVTITGLRESERMLQKITPLSGIPEKYTELLTLKMERLKSIYAIRKTVLTQFKQQLDALTQFLRKERKLLKDIAQKGDSWDRRQPLVRLYMDNGDFTLAAPLLVKGSAPYSENAEIQYFLGKIAAMQSDYDQMEEAFQKALTLNATFKKPIQNFRRQMGDQYHEYALARKTLALSTFKKLLLKGLYYDQTHAGLQAELKDLAQKDLSFLQAALTAKNHAAMPEVLEKWTHDLETHPRLGGALGPEIVARWYRYLGNYLTSAKEYQNAINCFNISLAHHPDDPEVLICLTDAFFALEDFDNGIAHLKAAVRIDPEYAVYWEHIGDNLSRQAQYKDAVLAYEQCFLAQPGKIYLLKKMGTCYQEDGQLEAAREALNLFKQKALSSVAEKKD